MNAVATAPRSRSANPNTNGIPMPRIGAALAGGIFAGIVRGTEADHALVLLDEAPRRMKWAEAKKWAEDQGASLPMRAEQAVLFGNLRDQFKDGGWYWSNESCAGDEAYAWCQGFADGTQDLNHEDGELRARAVRRLPLE